MKRFNKFNKLKSSIVALLLITISISCDDLVDENPISTISEETFYTNNDDIEAALMGVYDAMQGTYRQNHFLWGEFRSDNHQPLTSGSGNISLAEIANNNINQGNPGARWGNLYRMIDRANLILKNAPNIEDINENFVAETLILRAKAYFDAIRVWGDVPLFTEPVTSAEDATRPVTAAETIMSEVIIPDMLRAQELMDIPQDPFRFSKVSIYAFQAEVYMWLNEYPNAIEALDNLFALGGHGLVTTPEEWQDLFYNNPFTTVLEDARGKIQEGPELILSIRYELVENDRSGVMGLFFAGIPSYVLSEEIENKWREKFPLTQEEWEAKYPDTDPALTRMVLVDDGMGGEIEQEQLVYGDWRYFYCRAGGFEGINSVNIGLARNAKWQKTNYGADLDDTDIVLYRYAGMLLLLAEAENQVHADGGRALDLINQVRTARQLPPVSASEFGNTREDRLNFILDERQLELFGEGKRWWDLVRNDKAIELLNPILSERENGGFLTEDLLVWPIFDIHLIENPLLEQNPGYTN